MTRNEISPMEELYEFIDNNPDLTEYYIIDDVEGLSLDAIIESLQRDGVAIDVPTWVLSPSSHKGTPPIENFLQFLESDTDVGAMLDVEKCNTSEIIEKLELLGIDTSKLIPANNKEFSYLAPADNDNGISACHRFLLYSRNAAMVMVTALLLLGGYYTVQNEREVENLRKEDLVQNELIENLSQKLKDQSQNLSAISGDLERLNDVVLKRGDYGRLQGPSPHSSRDGRYIPDLASQFDYEMTRGDAGSDNIIYTSYNAPSERAWRFETLLATAKSGNSEAMYSIGRFYDLGIGVTQNISKAIYWLEKSSRRDNASAMLYLGKIYDRFDGGKRDYELSINWYKKAALRGNQEARDSLDSRKIDWQ